MSAPTVPRLHLLGPLGAVPNDDFPSIAARAVAGGVDAVHVRLPGGSACELLALACAVRERCPGARLLVNDRLDIALLAEANGAQLGEASVSVAEARQLLGPHALLGRSVHDLAGARQAAADGADFLLAGHVYATPSKAGQPGRGLAWLAEITAAVSTPVIALGGLNIERIPDALAAGAWGVAFGRELLTASDPAETARRARAAIDTYAGTGAQSWRRRPH
jgi:thiamine-phosphate pyrophosphorylase